MFKTLIPVRAVSFLPLVVQPLLVQGGAGVRHEHAQVLQHTVLGLPLLLGGGEVGHLVLELQSLQVSPAQRDCLYRFI